MKRLNSNEEESCEVDECREVGNNMIYITGMINSETISPAVGFIAAANSLNEHSHLVIFINSSGGDLTEGFALANTIKASRIPIYTVAIGECSSAALLIAMSGDMRFIGPDTCVLSHQYSCGIGISKYVDIRARQKDLELTADKLIKHYMLCTGLPMEEVKDRLVKDSDVFLSATEAVEFGLFDEFFEDFAQIMDFTEESSVLEEAPVV